jgi:GTP cyclohydrolase I
VIGLSKLPRIIDVVRAPPADSGALTQEVAQCIQDCSIRWAWA